MDYCIKNGKYHASRMKKGKLKLLDRFKIIRF